MCTTDQSSARAHRDPCRESGVRRWRRCQTTAFCLHRRLPARSEDVLSHRVLESNKHSYRLRHEPSDMYSFLRDQLHAPNPYQPQFQHDTETCQSLCLLTGASDSPRQTRPCKAAWPIHGEKEPRVCRIAHDTADNSQTRKNHKIE